jgi:YggT family protein
VTTVGAVLSALLYIFLVLLIGRWILETVQAFARHWHPRGAVLVLAETVYTATDPPLRLLRRFIPPLRVGNVAVDLSFMVLIFVVYILIIFVERL